MMLDRIIFYINGCPYCKEYMVFIEGINARLPLDKRIKLINCDLYYDYGIVNESLILKYKKYIKDTFPLLIFKKDENSILIHFEGSQDREILETFIKTLVIDEFLTNESSEFIFNPSCRFTKKISRGLFKKEKVICE